MKLGYRKSFIEKIRNMIGKNEFKRKMPEVLKIPYDKIRIK